ncbi:hypothetical protein OIU34_01975 [Pararhizobium sp. BT-229]|uniref:hypothetical protein n=1 Tax=Pararhizobium sp. BT-229 TaxID=2986923 RepID=UPI0021F7403E|nr:hypothetical protein [Pararhizobium sp. BT-229]MCV9960653.1 hypothetical protein [Pararhizobium sp. BT-229]
MNTPIWLTDLLAIARSGFSELLELNSIALLFALMTPLLLVYGRHEIRLRRLRAIKDFIQSFDQLSNSVDEDEAREEAREAAARTAAAAAAAGNDPAVQPQQQQQAGAAGLQVATPHLPPVVAAADRVPEEPSKDLRHNPSFEFVKSKYISDIEPKLLDGEKPLDTMSEVEQIDRIINVAARFGTGADRRILVSLIGLMIVCYYGFDAFQETVVCGFGLGGDGQACPVSATPNYGSYDKLRIIGSLAFIGAYIAAIRIFLRGLAVFDLSTFTFLRQTAETIASVALALAVYKAFPDPLYRIAETLGADRPAPQEIPWLWFALAPLFGLLPQSTTKFLLMKLQTLFQWVKTSDDRFTEVTKIISLDIIDGIDFETRFRLEECGIYDVQNLAAYNPIMLHIESPYGIYQVIDWIGQAQLCHILGPEKFLIFREMNIRTIFDLERAISDRESPPEFDEICIGILFAPTANLKQTMQIAGTKFVIMEDGEPIEVTLDEYNKWLQKKINAADKEKAAEHVMRWIADDLHVRRLRRLWKEISNSLGKVSYRLETSKI